MRIRRFFGLFFSSILAAAGESLSLSSSSPASSEQQDEEDTTTGDDNCLVIIPTVPLSNGVEMPVLQLGTAQLVSRPGSDDSVHANFQGMLPERVYRQIERALNNGLRAFDSALIYRSGPAIGSVLAEWWRTGQLDNRQSVWITTKIFHPDATALTFGISHMPDLPELSPLQISQRTLEHFETNLLQLGVGYVDLMLLHWPSGPGQEGGGADINRQQRLAAWKVLESVYSKGWARAIGVSNFSPQHLEQLTEDGATIVPMVNQIEASVVFQNDNILSYCQDHGIIVQAYSPFGSGLTTLPSELDSLADKYDKNVGQIALRYVLQKGYGSVVFLSNTERNMVSNTQIFDFELTEDEMRLLDGLNRPDGGWGLPNPNDLE